MGFFDLVNRLYYEESIHELAMCNRNAGEKISYNTIMYLDAITYIPQCTVSKLAERLHISKPAVTMKVNEMLKQGLIEKQQSDEDKRVFYLRTKKKMEEDFPEYNHCLRETEVYLNEKYTREEIELFNKIFADAADKYIEGLKESE